MFPQNKHNSTTIFFIFLVSIALAIFLAPAGGAMHNSFWRSSGCNFWGPCDTGSYIEGFIYSYMLLLTTFSFIFLKNKTSWKVFLYGTFIFWFFIFLVLFDALKFERSEYIGMLIIMLISSILGYFIALGVNKTMGYYKNRNNKLED